MKKQICILLLGLMVAMCGCQKNEEREISYETAALVTDDTKQIFCEDTRFEEEKHEEDYQNKNAAKEKQGSFLDASDELTYQETEKIFYTGCPVDLYKGKTDSQVKYCYFSDTNTLYQYYNENGLDIGIAADAAEEDVYSALEELLAEKLLPEGVEINQLRRMVRTWMFTNTVEDGIPTLTSDMMDGYILPEENQEAEYVICYAYPVGDIDSYESYVFNLTVDHALIQYRAPRPEIFNLSDDAIAKAKVQESVESFCKESFAEGTKAKQTNGQFWYRDSDGKLKVLTIMEIEYKREENIRGEIIELITSLE